MAPILYNQNYKKNYIEIQDFGNKTIFNELNKKRGKFNQFKKIVDLLIQIQSIKIEKLKHLKIRVIQFLNMIKRT